MRDGTLNTIRIFSFIGLIAVTGGCDTNAALSPKPLAEIKAQPGRAPDTRSKTDLARNRVWSLTRDGVFFHDRATPEKIVQVQLPDWQWAGTPYGCLPDLALGPKGEIVVTSDVLPTLWRIDPETLAVSVHPLELDADSHKDVGFSGLVYSSEHGAFFAVNYFHGSLWRIDPLFGGARKISLTAPVPRACGLAVRPRAGRQETPAGLCVRAPQGGWSIDLAPDQRTGHVRAASCTDR